MAPPLAGPPLRLPRPYSFPPRIRGCGFQFRAALAPTTLQNCNVRRPVVVIRFRRKALQILADTAHEADVHSFRGFCFAHSL
jgi:hypothetical protein